MAGRTGIALIVSPLLRRPLDGLRAAVRARRSRSSSPTRIATCSRPSGGTSRRTWRSRGGQRLAESRQFEAYNRLTAFMMHDLKNSVAQLQLIVANAASQRNPEFIDDAIGTIAQHGRSA